MFYVGSSGLSIDSHDFEGDEESCAHCSFEESDHPVHYLTVDDPVKAGAYVNHLEELSEAAEDMSYAIDRIQSVLDDFVPDF